MKRRSNHPAGFTLLELVLVMVIIVIAVGITAPRLTSWNRGQELRNSADMFISLTRLARSQAIANGVTYRIEFDAEAGKYQLKKQQGTEFVAINTTMGQIFKAPEGGKILFTAVTDARQASDNLICINFYPNGRSQKATIVISDKTGFTITAACLSPTDEFKVTEEGKAS